MDGKKEGVNKGKGKGEREGGKGEITNQELKVRGFWYEEKGFESWLVSRE